MDDGRLRASHHVRIGCFRRVSFVPIYPRVGTIEQGIALQLWVVFELLRPDYGFVCIARFPDSDRLIKRILRRVVSLSQPPVDNRDADLSPIITSPFIMRVIS